jgi:large repetitive protein
LNKPLQSAYITQTRTTMLTLSFIVRPNPYAVSRLLYNLIKPIGIVLLLLAQHHLLAQPTCPTDPALTFTISTTGCTGEAITVEYTDDRKADVEYTFIIDGETIPLPAGNNKVSKTFNTAGQKIIRIEAKKANECKSNQKEIIITEPKTPSFSVSSNSPVCGGNSLTFTPTFSDISQYDLNWDFGDGTQSTATSPSHTYKPRGSSQKNFTVTLTIKHNQSGCSRSILQTITIKEMPEIKLIDDFGAEIESFKNCDQASSITPTFTVKFTDQSTGSISNINIDWGDNSTPFSGPKPATPFQHTYASLGIYEITYTVTGSNGCTDTKKFTVYNISNPAVGASLPAGTLDCTPFEVQFKIENTSNNDPTTKYILNPGDGSPTTTINHPPPATFTHRYTETSCQTPDGFFTFTIIARNGCDESTASLKPIKIFSAPIADFSNPEEVCVNSTVTFTNTTVDGSNTDCSINARFEWDFGDGSPIRTVFNKDNQVHTYTQPGNYTITLLATNNKCGSTEKKLPITVCASATTSSFRAAFGGLQAIATPNQNAPGLLNLNDQCAPLTVNLTNLSNDVCTTQYIWSVVSGPTGYRFSNNLTSSTSPTTESLSFTQGGEYVVQLSATNICGTTLSYVKVIIRQPPTVPPVITGKDTYCENENVILAANPVPLATNYLWTIIGINGTPNPTVPISLTQLTLEPFTLPAGSYRITLQASNPCGMVSSNKDIRIFGLPIVSIIPTGPLSVCNSTTLELTGSTPAGAYQWFKDNLPITGATSTKYIVTTSGNYELHVVVNGCSGKSNTVAVDVKPFPQVSITSESPNQFCSENEVKATLEAIINPAGTYTFKWRKDGIEIPGATISTYEATTKGTYTVSISDGICEVTSLAYSITIFQPGAVQILPTNPSICLNESVTINASGAVTYDWSPAEGLSTTTGSVINASPQTTTTYTVIATDNNNCKQSINYTITVNPLPVLTLNASANDLCFGTSSTLTSTGAQSYEWSPSAGLNSVTGPSVVATPLQTTTYQVTGVSSFGCKSSTEIELSVRPEIVATITSIGNASYCTEDEVNVTLGTPELSGFFYEWRLNGTPIPSANSFTFQADKIGSYTVRVFDDKCEKISAPFELQLFERIPIGIDPPQPTLCRGDFITITATGAQSYTWVTDGTETTGTSITVSPTDNAPYLLKSVDQNGCKDELTFEIIVNDVPIVTANVSEPNLCFGESTTLTAEGAATYLWSPSTGLSSTTNPVVTATPSTTTTYQVTGFSPEGCTDIASIGVTVFSLPDLSAGEDVTYCDNFGEVSLYLNEGLNPTTGSWSGPGVVDGNFNPATAGIGIHTITYVVADPITNCENSDILLITVKSPPAIDFQMPDRICKDIPLTMINTTPDFPGNTLSFLWNFGNGSTSNDQNPTITFDSPGDFTVTLSGSTSPDNCFAETSKTIQVVDPPAAIFKLSVDENTLCGPITIEFTNLSTGTDLAYSWNFDNGITSTLLTPNPVEFLPNPYNDTTYVITLSVVSAEPTCPSTEFSETIIINPNPTANFLFAQNPVCADFPMPLNNYSFGKPTLFRWNFGDGSPEMETTRTGTIEHIFRNNDIKETTYTVTLTATNNCGEDILSRVLTVTPNTVDAFYEAGDITGCEPFNITFKSNQLPDTENEIIWDWGDGTFTYGDVNPTHTYETSGEFYPLLIVKNGCNIDTCQFNTSPSCGVKINVLENPEPVFTIEDPLCFQQPTRINSLAQNQVSSIWDMGDGTILSDFQPPQHTYTNTGPFTIEHKVTYSNGCIATYSKEAEVIPLPIPDFTVDKILCEGQSFTANNLSGNANSYLWRIDLTNTQIFSTATHFTTTVPGYGNYRLNLTAFTEPGQSGCKDSVSQIIAIGRVPDLDFTYSVVQQCDSFLITLDNYSTYPAPNEGNFNWIVNGTSLSSAFNPGTIIYRYSENKDVDAMITLFSESINGCSNSLSQPFNLPAFTETIEVPSKTLCFIPDDPINGIFKLKTETVLKEGYYMNIFNQWGNEVFQTDNRDDFWNGYYMQEVAPVGTYMANVKYRGCSTGNAYKLIVPLCVLSSSN